MTEKAVVLGKARIVKACLEISNHQVQKPHQDLLRQQKMVQELLRGLLQTLEEDGSLSKDQEEAEVLVLDLVEVLAGRGHPVEVAALVEVLEVEVSPVVEVGPEAQALDIAL